MKDFKAKVRDSLQEMIPKDHDDYREIKYNSNIYLHVWSHDKGEGFFELEIIIPHNSKNYKSNEQGSCLDDLEKFEEFEEKLMNLLENFMSDVEKIHPFQYVDKYVQDGKIPAHDVYYSSVVEGKVIN